MSFDPLSSLFELGKSAIDKIWPDPIKRAEELRKLEEMKQRGNLAELDAHVKLMMGQISINVEEAKSKSVFVAGWRPWIGWVGGMAMAYQFVLYPLLLWVWSIAQAVGWLPMSIQVTDVNGVVTMMPLSPPPVLATGALFSIVTGMLGIGAMRSHDKRHGVQTDKI